MLPSTEKSHLFQEELKIKLQPLQKKLKTFEEAKLTCDQTAAHIKVKHGSCNEEVVFFNMSS